MSFMVLTINITIDGSKWAPLGRLVWDFAGGQWLGLCTFTVEGQVHMVGELRFCKLCCALKKRKKD